MSDSGCMVSVKVCGIENDGFIINVGGTVTDPRTHLMWKRFSEGQEEKSNITEASVRTYTWTEALSWVERINMGKGYAGYRNWRLPTVQELLSIVSDKKVKPSIELDVFPHTPAAGYWTSSLFASGEDYAYVVDFVDGYQCPDFVSRRKPVRLVRDNL